jgi:hypothetical protein
VIGGTEEEQAAPMDVQGDSTVTPIEDHDPPRGGLGFLAGESGGYPEAGQVPQERVEATLKPTDASGPEGGRVWHCACRFCTSTSTAHDPPPSALDAGLETENHAFSKLVVFPDSFPSVPNYLVNMLQTRTEEELVDLFSRFMHLPLSEPVVRRILEVYIPMKSQCHQEATWTMSAPLALER